MTIYFSNSAYQNGFGSAPHKSACGQTKAEREAVKSGAIVLFDCGRKSGGGNGTGTTIRQIRYSKGYWQTRVPSLKILTQYESGNYGFIEEQ